MTALVFLIGFLFDLLVFLLLIRLLLGYFRFDFHNPVSRMILRLTDPAVVPLRRVIPGFGGVDWASVTLLLVLQAIAVVTLCAIVLGGLPHPLMVALWTVARAVQALVNLLIIAVLVRVILSWVAPPGYNPVVAVVLGLTEPILRPVRRRLPPLEGLDLSPMLVMIGLVFLRMLLVDDLIGLPTWL